MLKQRLQQKLLQKLSPQQILLMKLIQIPTVGLEQRIKQEIEENPALEVDASDEKNDDEFDLQNENTDNSVDEGEKDEPSTNDDEFDYEDYYDDDEIPNYRLQVNNRSADDEQYDIPFSAGTTFHEYLKQQLGFRKLDEDKYNIGLYIIGNIDDSGYLQRTTDSMVDDLAFTQNIFTTKESIVEVLKVIQDFDPPGVGARNLKECLLLQLNKKQKEESTEAIELAIVIIGHFFIEFTKKHYQKIIKRSDITETQLKQAIDEVLKLNPKPGNSLGETARTNHYIIPDFTIINNDGELELTLNSWNNSELCINNTYANMMNKLAVQKRNKSQKETYSFIKNKVNSAKWFIEAIRQRQNTLYSTMKAITEYQKEYFLTGDETNLRPMILKDIAEKVGMDISTISRVANSKYAQTPFGTFLLKSFFSESMQKDSGEEVSTREIKNVLKKIIDHEDRRKPYTDEQLTSLLKEKGYPIARRTVAKYREQLGIPVARLRKEL